MCSRLHHVGFVTGAGCVNTEKASNLHVSKKADGQRSACASVLNPIGG